MHCLLWLGCARLGTGRATRTTAQPHVPDAVGSWFGVARPENPATSPLQEVVMEPTFFADGNLIANHSHELTNPHTAAHGSWVRRGQGRIYATFLWMNIVPNKPNGFVGNFKVLLDGTVDPSSPDTMTGTLHPFLYGEQTDPLSPYATCGPLNEPPAPNKCYDLGVFRIAQLRRIKAYTQRSF